MKIVLIGAGNLATNLAKALCREGNEIMQVFSRTDESARMLAERVGAVALTDTEKIVNDADLYIFSLKDSVLTDIINNVCNGKRTGLFVHTAGSIAMDVFRNKADRYGVFYPMQSFSKQREVDFRHIPFFIEANSHEDNVLLHHLAESMSDNVYDINSEARKHLHLAAVFACNFANHCYEMSAEVLDKYNIPFSVMLQLIDETASKVHSVAPLDAQTGPAVRYDENVINMQRELLADNPRLQAIYDVMSSSIHERAKGNKL